MSYRVIICGFSNQQLTPDELKIIDENIPKWKGGWAKEPFTPMDSRNPDFKEIVESFASEEQRSDGKKIVIYSDFDIDEKTEKPKVLNLITELSGKLSAIAFQAYGDDGAPLT